MRVGGVRAFLERNVLYRGVTREYAFDGRGELLNPRVYLYRPDGADFPGALAAEVSVATPAGQEAAPRR